MFRALILKIRIRTKALHGYSARKLIISRNFTGHSIRAINVQSVILENPIGIKDQYIYGAYHVPASYNFRKHFIRPTYAIEASMATCLEIPARIKPMRVYRRYRAPYVGTLRDTLCAL